MIWGIVETQMESSSWTAVATSISAGISAATPVMLFLYMQVQKKREIRKVALLAAIEEKTANYANETKISLALLSSVTAQTHVLVNSRFREMLKTLAGLARNHAIMAMERAHNTRNKEDQHVADLAMMAADAAEKELNGHDAQQKAVDLKEATDAAIYQTLKDAGKLPIKTEVSKIVKASEAKTSDVPLADAL